MRKSVETTVGKMKAEPFLIFRPPRIYLDLAIGRKHDGWYLILARNYRLADSREIARLDYPGLTNRIHINGRPCFWYDTRAASGWEQNGQSLLELLLSSNNVSLFHIRTSEKPGVLPEVDVLLSEVQLAHCCESCGQWESSSGEFRWLMIRSSRLPGYLCPACCGKDWCGSQLSRYITRLCS